MNNLLTTITELELKKLEVFSEYVDGEIMRGKTEYRSLWLEIEDTIAEGYDILAERKYEKINL